MAALPYIQLYPADYLADTAHLNAAQHGAYLLLIMNYWQTGAPLKDSNVRLANVARMSQQEWIEARELLEEFFEIKDGEWIHHRIERDLSGVYSKSKNASMAGKASAEARRIKRLTNVATNVQQNVNHTDVDVDVDVDVDTDLEQKQNQKTLQLVGTPAPVKAKKVAKQKDPEAEAKKEANAKTWQAYADSYFNRYSAEPVRNAKANKMISEIVKRLGADEAPHVAFYYVTINDSFFIKNVHDLGLLLSKCESVRTQWVTGTQITGTTARQIENTQSNISAAEEAKRMMREGGIQNAFLKR